MKRRKRPLKKRNLKVYMWLTVGILLLLIGFFYLDRHVMPLVKTYACMQAEQRITLMINRAVTTVLSEEDTTYEQLVKVNTDANGTVMSVEADVQTINRLKAALSVTIAEQGENMRNMTVSIPLGTLLGSRLFGGRGPMIRIPVSASVSVLSDFDSMLTAAGINQTAHRIYLHTKVSAFLAVPTAHTSTQVQNSFIVAESVLLGKVPDAYTVVENIDEETVGEIFDYGAHMQN